jgi:hypothetical protein
MTSPVRNSTAAGVNFELEARGKFQTEYANVYGVDGPHPAHAVHVRPAKYALFEEYTEPITGQTAADSFSTTQKFEFKPCATYLYGVTFTGEFSAVTTTQAAANTTNDTIFLKQLAPYVAINQARLDIGCNGAALYEQGDEHRILYDRVIPSDRRWYEQAIDGGATERANWSRVVTAFGVPLMFDCFLMSGSALRVLTMTGTPVSIELTFNSAESVYHRTGVANANNGGATPLLFAPGQMQQVRLMGKYIKLPAPVEATLRNLAPTRVTFYRQWYRHSVVKPNDAVDITIPIPAVRNTMTMLLICPRNDQFQVTPTTRIGAPGNPEAWLIDTHNFWGPITLVGGAEVVRAPYAGAEFYVDGQLRSTGDFNKLTNENMASYFNRNPTLYKERIGGWAFEPKHMRFGHQTGIQLTNQQGIYVIMRHAYGGVTTPAWGGRVELKWQSETIIITGQTGTKIIY